MFSLLSPQPSQRATPQSRCTGSTQETARVWAAATQPPYGWREDAEQWGRLAAGVRVAHFVKYNGKLHFEPLGVLPLLFNSAPLQPHGDHGSALWPLPPSVADSIKAFEMDWAGSSVRAVQTDWQADAGRRDAAVGCVPQAFLKSSPVFYYWKYLLWEGGF